MAAQKVSQRWMLAFVTARRICGDEVVGEFIDRIEKEEEKNGSPEPGQSRRSVSAEELEALAAKYITDEQRKNLQEDPQAGGVQDDYKGLLEILESHLEDRKKAI